MAKSCGMSAFGAKRTSQIETVMSANDPRRTLADYKRAHLLLDRANFHPTNVLPDNGRERYREQHSRMGQKLPRSGPTPPKPWLLRFHWPEIIR